ncbi:hypothetical protein D3C78_1565300 [compost metagenome]
MGKDGHPIDGDFSFTVNAQTESTTEPKEDQISEPVQETADNTESSEDKSVESEQKTNTEAAIDNNNNNNTEAGSGSTTKLLYIAIVGIAVILIAFVAWRKQRS